MTYEDIVFDYNSRALDARTWDMISDRERVEFVLRVRGMQEPVCYQALFDAIAAATSVAYVPGINISIEAFTAKIGPLYAAPQPCQECEKLKAERDELKNDLADMLDAKNGIGPTALSTVISQRDELAAQVEKMREFLQFLWRDAQLNEYTFARLEEMIALPDLSTSILDKVRAEALDAKRYRWLRSSSVGPAQIWELLSDDCNPPVMTLKSMGDLDAAIDSALGTGMEAGKC